jgi:hypothetical protein
MVEATKTTIGCGANKKSFFAVLIWDLHTHHQQTWRILRLLTQKDFLE